MPSFNSRKREGAEQVPPHVNPLVNKMTRVIAEWLTVKVVKTLPNVHGAGVH